MTIQIGVANMGNESDIALEWRKIMQYENKKRFLVNFGYWTVILGLSFLAFKYVLPIVMPLMVAFLFAALLNKPISKINQKWKVKRSVIAIPIITLFFILIGFFITLIGFRLYAAGRQIWIQIPDFYYNTIQPATVEFVEAVEGWFLNWNPNLESTIDGTTQTVIEAITSFAPNLSVGAVSLVSNFAVSVPQGMLNVLITIIVTYFMTLEYKIITAFILRQFPKKAYDMIIEIKGYLFGTLLKIIGSYLVIMCITFMEMTIGLSILQVENAVLVAIIIAIFDILPVLGSGGILIPWGIISFLTGEFKMGIGLIIIYLIVTIIRNIIEPKIVGQQVGLSPVVVLGSMLLGVSCLGVIGLFGFPIALSVIKNLNDKGMIHIFK